MEFFKTPDQLDFSGISMQATTQLERARKLAAQYAAAALQSRPKLIMHLDLDAPKVRVVRPGLLRSCVCWCRGRQRCRSAPMLLAPTPCCVGGGACEGRARARHPGSGLWPLHHRVWCVGGAACAHTTRASFEQRSSRCCAGADADTPAKLGAEEAALYECVRMNARDVAAFMVDGDFDWQKQQVGFPPTERAQSAAACSAGAALRVQGPASECPSLACRTASVCRCWSAQGWRLRCRRRASWTRLAQ